MKAVKKLLRYGRRCRTGVKSYNRSFTAVDYKSMSFAGRGDSCSYVGSKCMVRSITGTNSRSMSVLFLELR
jgi:hypothetical protein